MRKVSILQLSISQPLTGIVDKVVDKSVQTTPNPHEFDVSSKRPKFHQQKRQSNHRHARWRLDFE
jgi:hypothetical protein